MTIPDEQKSTPQLVLEILLGLEWSAMRAGCSAFPGAHAPLLRCCPKCYGIDPIQDMAVKYFPYDQIGHQIACPILAKITTLQQMKDLVWP